MQGSGGLEPPEPGGDDEDSVRSVTDSEQLQSEEEKTKWNKKDCVHPQLIYVISKLRSTSFLTTQLGGYMPIFSPGTRCFYISETRMLGIYL